MTESYRFDPARSRFTVQAFATGLLSVFGHSPRFAVTNFSSEMGFVPGTFADARLRLTARTDSLQLLDQVKPADRQEIEGRMRGEVLETTAYPDASFQSNAITASPLADYQYRLRIAGLLTLHGLTNPEQIEAVLKLATDGVLLAGNFILSQSRYRISPVSALGGTIRLKDEVRLGFDLVGEKVTS
jgi:polyisoprenoid-binding protein YceI